MSLYNAPNYNWKILTYKFSNLLTTATHRRRENELL